VSANRFGTKKAIFWNISSTQLPFNILHLAVLALQSASVGIVLHTAEVLPSE